MVSREQAVIEYFEKYPDDLRKLHYSPEKELKPYSVVEKLMDDRLNRYKPCAGLWYSVGSSWSDWCSSEMPGMVKDYLHEFLLDESKIICISNVEELDAFTEKYHRRHPFEDMPQYEAISRMLPKHHDDYIDWKRVAKDCAGLQIAPYLWERRLSIMWYYGWDCASGVIWDMSAMKSCRLVAVYNEKEGKYDVLRHL